MANRENVLRLLRNTELFSTRQEALNYINVMANKLGDGEFWVATYGNSGNAKSILALKRTWGLTIFDLEAISETIQENSYKYKMIALTSAEIEALPDASNIKEAYHIVSYQGEETEQTVYTEVGDIVKIYKDSSLVENYLGSDSDIINASTGAITKYAYELKTNPSTKITAQDYESLPTAEKELYQPIDSQSLNFAYQLADGSYTLTKVDVSKFLSENEFGNGLQVSNSGVVSLKVDNTSADSEDFITVSENGVKISGVQDAINESLEEIEEVTAASLNDLELRKADKSEVQELLADYLTNVEAGNGIETTTPQNGKQTVTVKLNATDNALTLNTDGLYLSKTIDCGEY